MPCDSDPLDPDPTPDSGIKPLECPGVFESAEVSNEMDQMGILGIMAQEGS